MVLTKSNKSGILYAVNRRILTMPGAASVEIMSTSFKLFRKLEELADALQPNDYILPPVASPPQGTIILGEATDTMKRLWTLFAQLQMKRALGQNELLIRAVHVAMSFEIGQHFNHWGAHVGISADWRVYSAN